MKLKRRNKRETKENREMKRIEIKRKLKKREDN